jgi:hypothetical protein
MPWPVHPNGLLGAQGDNDSYRVERSLRFNSADNAYLSRTMGTPTSQTTATLSLWVKRSGISKTNYGDSFWDAEASNYNLFGFAGTGSGNTDSLLFSFRAGGTYYSNAVYRDPSAWYHIVCVYDSTNATQADRFRFFVNGVRGTFISTPAFALGYTFESSIGAGTYRIADFSLNSQWRPDFYLAEYYWIDGQALSPSSFGETDAITGRWKAKVYSGTYGNNGFYLKFADNSGTTDTTLGKDSSGNGNNWTPNNFSVTAGIGNDSLVDSPTNYGSDTGVGGAVRGNYCTLNPLSNNGGTMVDGNLDFYGSSAFRFAGGTIAVSSGKWYIEATHFGASVGNTEGNVYSFIGFIKPSTLVSAGLSHTSYTSSVIGIGDSGWAYNFASGSSVTTGFGSGDIASVSIDFTTGSYNIRKNNTSITSGTMAFTGELIPAIFSYESTYRWQPNFGQRPFAYTAPTGFKALCTTNFSTPTIKKPSTAMDVVAYTGTCASNSISSLGFSPDLVWIKNRGGATSHAIYDTTRGTQSQLSSDTTGDQVTSSSGLTTFGSNGFTISTSTLVNTTGTQYVAWAWDQSTQDGFTISTYTGNGANRTINHTLGVAPKMVIVKARTTAGADQGWPVWHTSIANTTYLQLNSTSATATGADYWNSTSPTSSVFSVGTNAAVNANADTYIAYLFAEVDGFSKIGSYTGNATADGTFVYCGFLPSFILIKSSTAADAWLIYDNKRNTFNVASTNLVPNTNAADATISGIDFVSNGFKLRTITTTPNAAQTYIFAAFAESPFKYARAR